MRRTRRSLLTTLAALPPAAWLAPRSLLAGAAELAPTPACGNEAPTPRQTAGPFYKPASPERRNLRNELGRGEPIDVAGRVVDTRCRPLARVIVEIWHADNAGDYDNSGFHLRGWQHTDAEGRWGFETIVPQHYTTRTAHYHFRLQRPDGGALTTQLYFPEHPRNAADRIFDPRLVMQIAREDRRQLARFDFVLGS